MERAAEAIQLRLVPHLRVLRAWGLGFRGLGFRVIRFRVQGLKGLIEVK